MSQWPDPRTREYRKRARQSNRLAKRLSRTKGCNYSKTALACAMPGSNFREKHKRDVKNKAMGRQNRGTEIKQRITGLGTLVGGAIAAKRFMFNKD